MSTLSLCRRVSVMTVVGFAVGLFHGLLIVGSLSLFLGVLQLGVCMLPVTVVVARLLTVCSGGLFS